MLHFKQVVSFVVVGLVLECSCFLMKNNESTDIGTLLEISGYPRRGDIPVLNRKIFKGRRVSVREHPYVVSIRRLLSHYLVGSLLSKNVLITVAHSLVNVPTTELGVVLGESYCDRGTFVSTVVFVIIHQLFDPYTLTDDIAMLRLYEDSHYRFNVKAIQIVARDADIESEIAFVTGWGRCDNTGSELCLSRSSKFYPDEKVDPMLRTVSFTLRASNDYCEGYKRHEVPISSGMLCTGPAREEDPVCPCMGVPGAPLVVHGRLAGILSWGFGCGYGHDLPLIYTSMKNQSKWILHNAVRMRNIFQSNLTQLYEITKAYLITEWFKQTRVIKPTLKIRRDRNMEPLDIDMTLSDLLGKVYDVRDFINDGMLSQEKKNMYDTLVYDKQKMQQYKLISDGVHKQIQPRPFLSNNTLKKMFRSKLVLEAMVDDISNTKNMFPNGVVHSSI